MTILDRYGKNGLVDLHSIILVVNYYLCKFSIINPIFFFYNSKKCVMFKKSINKNQFMVLSKQTNIFVIHFKLNNSN